MNRALHMAPGVQENNTIGSIGIVIHVSERCKERRMPVFDLCQAWFPAEVELCLRTRYWIGKKSCQFDCHLPEI